MDGNAANSRRVGRAPQRDHHRRREGIPQLATGVAKALLALGFIKKQGGADVSLEAGRRAAERPEPDVAGGDPNRRGATEASDQRDRFGADANPAPHPGTAAPVVAAPTVAEQRRHLLKGLAEDLANPARTERALEAIRQRAGLLGTPFGSLLSEVLAVTSNEAAQRQLTIHLCDAMLPSSTPEQQQEIRDIVHVVMAHNAEAGDRIGQAIDARLARPGTGNDETACRRSLEGLRAAYPVIRFGSRLVRLCTEPPVENWDLHLTDQLREGGSSAERTLACLCIHPEALRNLFQLHIGWMGREAQKHEQTRAERLELVRDVVDTALNEGAWNPTRLQALGLACHPTSVRHDPQGSLALMQRVLRSDHAPAREIALVGLTNPHTCFYEGIRDAVEAHRASEDVAWLRTLIDQNLRLADVAAAGAEAELSWSTPALESGEAVLEWDKPGEALFNLSGALGDWVLAERSEALSALFNPSRRLDQKEAQTVRDVNQSLDFLENFIPGRWPLTRYSSLTVAELGRLEQAREQAGYVSFGFAPVPVVDTPILGSSDLTEARWGLPVTVRKRAPEPTADFADLQPDNRLPVIFEFRAVGERSNAKDTRSIGGPLSNPVYPIDSRFKPVEITTELYRPSPSLSDDGKLEQGNLRLRRVRVVVEDGPRDAEIVDRLDGIRFDQEIPGQ